MLTLLHALNPNREEQLLNKWKLLSRTTVCEGSTTVENCLPLASRPSDRRTSPIIYAQPTAGFINFFE
ncbi:hypothetical protein [Lactococcus petauri]|uniref:hypothetical protein n=1 Tax=Lactococcus petauri TaxID=1940789 RepID=UPI001034C8F4|nr:hypothetical protein [Lactococcus petauri]MCI3872127.1 hypothetical protein [Lactococcus petauri]MCR6590268.1 hypothetical protein [Lactococcus petauri]MCU7364766.1 hypothetical protein [Lactococcus petauri]MCV5953729.1 hypothetical protein [Lactococcus petauri]MCV5970784.1 hypothetical protein [Lactococcus petauri]